MEKDEERETACRKGNEDFTESTGIPKNYGCDLEQKREIVLDIGKKVFI